MDLTEYKELLEKYNLLYSKLSVIDYFIVDFKEDQSTSIHKLEGLTEVIKDLSVKTNGYSKDKNTNIKKIQHIEHRILNVETNLIEIEGRLSLIRDSLESLEKKIITTQLVHPTPSLSLRIIELINAMDLKKWAALVGIFISILTSAGILDGFIDEQKENSNGTKEQIIKDN
jgi:septal ring factor EnvC (AmiA/AmiB activator)